MANASSDENRIPTIISPSSVDGTTMINIKVNSTNHGIKISDGSTGSDLSSTPAHRDENRVTGIMAVSSADGVTPIEIYADPATGALLIKST